MQFFALFGYIYYSFNLDKKLFSTHIFEAKGFFGGFSKVFFASSIGISIASKKNYIKNKRIKAILFSLLNICLIKKLLKLSKKFYLIKLFTIGLGSSSIFILFSLLPFDSIKSQKINSMITKFIIILEAFIIFIQKYQLY